MTWSVTVSNYRAISEEKPLTIDLSLPITAFLGPNNSGKTSALKFFWEFADVLSITPRNLGNNVRQSPTGAIFATPIRPSSVLSAVFSEFNVRPIRVRMEYKHQARDEEHFGIFGVKSLVPLCLDFEIERNTNNVIAKISDATTFVSQTQSLLQCVNHGDLVCYIDQNHNVGHYFTNSSLIHFANPFFVPAVRVATHANNQQNYNLNLGSLAFARWNDLKRSEESHMRKLASTIERELADFFGYDSIALTTSNQETDFIVEMNRTHSNVMKDMGTGFNHLLAILLNLVPRNGASPNNAGITLIDEPEAGLHPKMQHAFIKLIARYANGPLLFATHSLGLARATADQIISFKSKGGRSSCENFAQSRHHLELLGEMSFASWTDVGCEGVLFVEGPHDVRVFSEWIRHLGMSEDWAVLPLGGSTTICAGGANAIVQAKKIHPRVVVVIDSEKADEIESLSQKRQTFVDECKSAGLECFVTALRSTDNYLSSAAIKKVVGTAADSLEKFEKVGGKGWGKSNSQKIAAAMTREEVLLTDVGQFLHSLLQRSKQSP